MSKYAPCSPEEELKHLRRRVLELEADLMARDTHPHVNYRHYANVSATLLNSIFESTEDLIAAMDTNFRYLAFNSAYQTEFQQVFGPTIGIGTNMLEALAHLPGERQKAEELWRRALEGEQFTITQEFGNPSTRRSYELRFNTLRNEAGEVIGAIHFVRDNTARKRAEADLLAAHDRARNILESITDAFLALDSEWRVTYINREAERALRLRREDLLGKNIWQQSAPAVDSLSWHQCHRAVRENVAVHFEDYYATLDTWFHVHAFPGADGLSVYFENINDRKNAEARLTESEKRFSSAFALAPVGIVLTTPDGVILEANQAFQDMLGYTTAELEGRTSASFTPAEELLATRQFFQQFQDGKNSTRVLEKPYLHKRGFIVWARVWATMRRDENGKPLQVVAIILDITQQKRAEEDRRRFSFAIEQSSDFISIANPQGEVFFLNEAGRRLAGLDQITRSRPSLNADFFAPDQQRFFAETITPIVWGEGHWAGETSFRHFETQTDVPVNCSISVIRDEANKPVAVATIARDISDQRRAAEEMRGRNEELLRANRELEEFSYVASHDLQEPLRMVNIYTHLLLQEFSGNLTERTQEFVSYVENGVRRMQALISDLLDYSRAAHASDDDMRDGVVRVALNDLFVEAIGILAERIRESSATITCGPLPSVLGDPSQLGQVLQNLLTNALKYRKANVSPQISISATTVDGQAIVAIRDNGIGFDPQHAERIFGLFKRLHKTEYPGTGLGLAISKRIVERYGGRMWAESKEGEGSTFYFSLKEA